MVLVILEAPILAPCFTNHVQPVAASKTCSDGTFWGDSSRDRLEFTV